MFDEANTKIRKEQQEEGARRKLIARVLNKDTGVLLEKDGVRTVEKKGNRQNFIAKGHDRILEKLQQSGDDVWVYLFSDLDCLRGKVIARDRYTVVIESERSRNLVFKSAISFIRY